MTTPDGPPVAAAQVAIGVDVQRQADGSWWVVLQWGIGPMASALWMTPENALEYAHSIQGALTNASKEANRKNSGLIVPGE